MPPQKPSSPAKFPAGEPPAPLQTEEDYDAALREIEQYFRTEPDFGTSDAQRFDQLAEQIRLYEGTHWPISPTDATT